MEEEKIKKLEFAEKLNRAKPKNVYPTLGERNLRRKKEKENNPKKPNYRCM
jgi:hypothetical protein